MVTYGLWTKSRRQRIIEGVGQEVNDIFMLEVVCRLLMLVEKILTRYISVLKLGTKV